MAPAITLPDRDQELIHFVALVQPPHLYDRPRDSINIRVAQTTKHLLERDPLIEGLRLDRGAFHCGALLPASVVAGAAREGECHNERARTDCGRSAGTFQREDGRG